MRELNKPYNWIDEETENRIFSAEKLQEETQFLEDEINKSIDIFGLSEMQSNLNMNNFNFISAYSGTNYNALIKGRGAILLQKFGFNMIANTNSNAIDARVELECDDLKNVDMDSLPHGFKFSFTAPFTVLGTDVARLKRHEIIRIKFKSSAIEKRLARIYPSSNYIKGDNKYYRDDVIDSRPSFVKGQFCTYMYNKFIDAFVESKTQGGYFFLNDDITPAGFFDASYNLESDDFGILSVDSKYNCLAMANYMSVGSKKRVLETEDATQADHTHKIEVHISTDKVGAGSSVSVLGSVRKTFQTTGIVAANGLLGGGEKVGIADEPRVAGTFMRLLLPITSREMIYDVI